MVFDVCDPHCHTTPQRGLMKQPEWSVLSAHTELAVSPPPSSVKEGRTAVPPVATWSVAVSTLSAKVWQPGACVPPMESLTTMSVK